MTQAKACGFLIYGATGGTTKYARKIFRAPFVFSRVFCFVITFLSLAKQLMYTAAQQHIFFFILFILPKPLTTRLYLKMKMVDKLVYTPVNRKHLAVETDN